MFDEMHVLLKEEVEFEVHSIQHVIKFVSDLWKLSLWFSAGSLFLPPIKLKY